MDDTLKIERALTGLTEWQKHVQTGSDIDRDISVAVEVLKAQLDTDVPDTNVGDMIIRCKDCKHWMPYDWMFSEVWQSKNIADYPEDEIGCNLCDVAMKANDFCSRGERRQDG